MNEFHCGIIAIVCFTLGYFGGWIAAMAAVPYHTKNLRMFNRKSSCSDPTFEGEHPGPGYVDQD